MFVFVYIGYLFLRNMLVLTNIDFRYGIAAAIRATGFSLKKCTIILQGHSVFYRGLLGMLNEDTECVSNQQPSMLLMAKIDSGNNLYSFSRNVTVPLVY